ncbi:MAG: hypothetical protein FJ301_12320 [Planctomycetes bacterium]|nr:hypothetical protein [Planctomycetota bacterium]
MPERPLVAAFLFGLAAILALVAATLLVVLLLMIACGAGAEWPAYAGIAALLALALGLRALSRACEQGRV